MLILVDSFLVISSAIIYGYYAVVLKIDEEDFGGHGALLQEGLFASITVFLVLFLRYFLLFQRDSTFKHINLIKGCICWSYN